MTETHLAMLVAVVLLQGMFGWRWFIILLGGAWWMAGRARWLAIVFGLGGLV